MGKGFAVLLDVDGTLVDSNYFHALAWFRAFRRAGRSMQFARVHGLIGMGADQFLETLVGEHDKELESYWQEEFAQLRGEIVATPGATDLVRTLHQRGAATVYATSGQPQDVDVMREIIGADAWVDAVVNSSEVDASKPAPDIFELALQRAGVHASDAIVVGDTVWDVNAATAAGLDCVGVTTGGIGARELTAEGAVAVYDSPADLLEHLRDSPLARFLV